MMTAVVAATGIAALAAAGFQVAGLPGAGGAGGPRAGSGTPGVEAPRGSDSGSSRSAAPPTPAATASADSSSAARPPGAGGEVSLTLTRQELYLIAETLRVADRIGLANPWAGTDQSARDQAAAGTREALVERGVLEVLPDGSLAPVPMAAGLVSALAAATRAVTITATDQSGASEQRSVRAAPRVLVEYVSQSDDRSCLTALRDPALGAKRWLESGRLPDAPAAPGEPILLAETELAEARRLARSSPTDCQAYLQAHGVGADGAAALAATLSDGEQTGSIQSLRRERQVWVPGEADGWLASADACWRVQARPEEDSGRLLLVPAASGELAASLTTMLGGLAPSAGASAQQSV
jgi:hypothetical protein